ncbi:hypothetical protein MRB53_038418 [Persea americana]|nr:hypothetical protein MRB53_038418 [Persea americana]
MHDNTRMPPRSHNHIGKDASAVQHFIVREPERTTAVTVREASDASAAETDSWRALRSDICLRVSAPLPSTLHTNFPLTLVIPPSTRKSCPLTKELSSLAKNSTACACSMASPNLPEGKWISRLKRLALSSPSQSCSRGVLHRVSRRTYISGNVLERRGAKCVEPPSVSSMHYRQFPSHRSHRALACRIRQLWRCASHQSHHTRRVDDTRDLLAILPQTDDRMFAAEPHALDIDSHCQVPYRLGRVDSVGIVRVHYTRVVEQHVHAAPGLDVRNHGRDLRLLGHVALYGLELRVWRREGLELGKTRLERFGRNVGHEHRGALTGEEDACFEADTAAHISDNEVGMRPEDSRYPAPPVTIAFLPAKRPGIFIGCVAVQSYRTLSMLTQRVDVRCPLPEIKITVTTQVQEASDLSRAKGNGVELMA